MENPLDEGTKWVSYQEARNWIAYRTFANPATGPARWMDAMVERPDANAYKRGRNDLADTLLMEAGAMKRIRFLGIRAVANLYYDEFKRVDGAPSLVPPEYFEEWLSRDGPSEDRDSTLYMRLAVNHDDLVRAFPSRNIRQFEWVTPEHVSAVVSELQGYVTVSDFKITDVSRGRRHKWHWHAFWREIVLRAHSGRLPKKQSELVAGMSQWYIDTFGDAPSESDLKEVLRPLYHAIAAGESEPT